MKEIAKAIFAVAEAISSLSSNVSSLCCVLMNGEAIIKLDGDVSTMLYTRLDREPACELIVFKGDEQ